MKNIAILCLILLVNSHAMAQTTANFPHWQFSADPDKSLLKGPFEQSKTTPFLRRALKSSGQIIISSAQGILWQTHKPIKSTMVLTQQAIVTVDSKNNSKTLTGNSDLNLVFLNAMSGQWQALTPHFELKHTELKDKKLNNTKHCVGLTPKSALTSQSLKHIQVCGTQTVIQTMNIEETGDSKTTISLSLKPYKALTQNELALFSYASAQTPDQ